MPFVHVVAGLRSLAVAVSVAYASAASALIVIPGVAVLGTSDPWLAGMPNGATASLTDTAPAQSPVEVTGLSLAGGHTLTFATAGCANNDPVPCSGTPDGGSFFSHETGAENGISDVSAPINALVGVFLGPGQPSSLPAPPALDFQGGGSGLDFMTLSPLLQQVFFIGDGTTADGAIQRFIAPALATRLFLGSMDGRQWSNNFGGFTVTVTSDATQTPPNGTIPLPSTLSLLAMAGSLMLLSRRIDHLR